MKKYLFILLGIFLISLSSATPTLNLEARTSQANTLFNYTFNFTTSSDCSGVLLSYSDDILTDSNGNYMFQIPISSLSSKPNYLCEYKNNALRKTHEFSDLIFNTVWINTTNTQNIYSNNWSNVSITESQISDLTNTSTLTVNNTEYFDGYSVSTLYTYYRGLLQTYFNGVYCQLTGCTMAGDIDMDGNDINMGNGNITEANCIELSGNTYCNFETTYYNATSGINITGTTAGSINLTQHPDGNYDEVTFNITETAGSPGLDLRVNFTGDITTFNKGYLRYYTSTLQGDYPIIQLWDYCDNEWEGGYGEVIEATLDFFTIAGDVLDSSCHVSDGIVQMRLYKSANGNTNNEYYIDMLAIVDGYATPSGNVELSNYWRKGNTEEFGNFYTSGNLTATGTGTFNQLNASLTNGSVLFYDGSKISQDNSKLFWDNVNKRLGMGVSTPNWNIHLHNAGSGSSGFQMTNGDSGTGSNDGMIVGYVVDYALIANNEAGEIAIATNGKTILKGWADGRVAIGKTGQAQAPLEIYKLETTGTNEILRLTNGYAGTGSHEPLLRFDNGAGTQHWSLVAGVSGASTKFRIIEGTTDMLTILRTSGNVGIGTTTPNQKLQVVGNGNFTGSLYAGDGFTGNCVNASFVSGIAVGCND